ncbi:hypothetical protein [Peribacillus muralis]|uniref:hypothetical protein n=1 Tax=Peribacillus muralis TaxID=264697 RepID=UPI003D0307F4
MNKNLNRFMVDYYLKDKLLLSNTIESWDQYIAALKASDTVTINNKEYVVNKINFFHDTSDILKMIVKVYVEPLN